MFFPIIQKSFTFPLCNKTGYNLTGNNQKIFFTNLGFLKNKLIRAISIYDSSNTNGGLINFNGTPLTFFDTIKDTQKTYVNLIDIKGNFILQNFPANELVQQTLNNSKFYNFFAKIDWEKSFVIKSDLTFSWDINTGFLMQVYYND